MERAYGFLEVKAYDDDKREIEGIASTISSDRDGDILIPEGAVIKTPFPFLYHHDRYQPIGEVYEAKVTKKGIYIKARLAKVEAPSQLAARLDEAWASIKTRLVRGISVGFRPLERSVNEMTGGWIFPKWEMLECSAVTIAANQDATITNIKSVAKHYASKGSDNVKVTDKPSVKTEKKTVKLLNTQEGKMTTKITEKLAQFRATHQTKSAELAEMAEKSTDETFDEADKEKFDALQGEVTEVAEHIERLETAEKALTKSLSTAKPITKAVGETEDGAKAHRQSVPATVKAAEPKLEKGIEFARYAMCQVAAKGDHRMALELAKTHYGKNEKLVNALDYQAKNGGFERIMKATVEAGTTLDATWAAPLVDYQNFAGDFVEYLRPRTIIGQFGVDGKPALRQIPFNVRITGQTSGGTAYWVGEGAPKPLTAFDFNATELRWSKIASIAVLTEELIRFSDPSAERLVRDALADVVIERADIDFVNPAKAAVANVSPASITNGISAIPSSGGTDADAVRCDIQALWAPFIAARNPARNAVYIMDSTTALALSQMRNPLGAREFDGITVNGGTLDGTPVIVSDYMPAGVVILVNASDIWLADDGQVTIDASREASLQMLDNPTNNSATGTPTTMVSMFQTNSVALRAERYINWARRRVSAVSYLTGVNWGACAT